MQKVFFFLVAVFLLGACADKPRQEEDSQAGSTPKEETRVEESQDEDLALIPAEEIETAREDKESPSTTRRASSSRPGLGATSKLSQRAAPEQYFTIAPTEPKQIEGKKGTQVSIPEGAFVHQDGSPVKEAVTFKMREFYSKSDFLLAGLTTHSEGQILESGGMLYLEAYSEGKKLKLAEGKTLEVALPKRNTRPSSAQGMELFYGDQHTADAAPDNWGASRTPMPIESRQNQPAAFHNNVSSLKHYDDFYRGAWKTTRYRLEVVEESATLLYEGSPEVTQKRKEEPLKKWPNDSFEQIEAKCAQAPMPSLPLVFEENGREKTRKEYASREDMIKYGKPLLEVYDTVRLLLMVEPHGTLGRARGVSTIGVVDGFGQGLDRRPEEYFLDGKGGFHAQFVLDKDDAPTLIERGKYPYKNGQTTFTTEFVSPQNKKLKYMIDQVILRNKKYLNEQLSKPLKAEFEQFAKFRKKTYPVIVWQAVIRTTKYRTETKVIDQVGHFHYDRTTDPTQVTELLAKHKIESPNRNHQDRSRGDIVNPRWYYLAPQPPTDYYLANLNTLGWINCDRFYQLPQEERDNLLVQGAKAPVRMVFRDINSVLRGKPKESGTYAFENIPKEAAVTLFSVQKKDKKLYLALKETKVGTGTQQLVYQEVSQEELLSQIRRLN